jgi:hypothetical protein
VFVLLVGSLYLLTVLLVNPLYLFVFPICPFCWLVSPVVCFICSIFVFPAHYISLVSSLCFWSF